MTEQICKTIINGLWSTHMKSQEMLNALESIGLYVDGEKGTSKLHSLYGILDNVAATIVDMFGPIENRDNILTSVDDFLIGMGSRVQDCDEGIPDEAYTELISILKSMGVKLPWENNTSSLQDSYDNYRRHRAIAIKDNKPVTGYLWIGASHAYITPDNLGISFDDETAEIKAYAVEVYQETIAIDMLILDSNMVNLFEGDTVRVGDDTFVLTPMDMNVLQKLSSSERKEKGLYRVKANYEDFVSKNK